MLKTLVVVFVMPIFHPPNMDRLDVAGGLNPSSSEPGNKESTDNVNSATEEIVLQYPSWNRSCYE